MTKEALDLFVLDINLPDGDGLLFLDWNRLAWSTPSEAAWLEPYSAIEYPQIAGGKKISVKAVSAERTFWEKATILLFIVKPIVQLKKNCERMQEMFIGESLQFEDIV